MVTETYTVTRKARVIAPSEKEARDWDVHPKVFVLEHNSHDEGDFNVTVEELNVQDK
jgi:hypothetical protein